MTDELALLVWSDHAELENETDHAVYAIVADDFTFEPGTSWPSERESAP